jgi:putative ABC transport system ATP-binding protein
MSEYVLELRGVTRVHGHDEGAVTALDAVSMTVAPGELVAVMGPSGSGKSTLLNVAGGLDSPTSGDVVVEGTRLGGLTRSSLAQLRRRSIGYVFQSLNLIPSLTAAENVMLPRELDGVPARRARGEALSALAEFGLTDLADRFPDDMSGGQQQRVAIARALALRPSLMLLDEPTSALDPELVGSVLDVIRKMRREGMTMLIVSHEMQFAREAADKVIFLDHGRIVEAGPPAQIFGAPRNERTAAFLSRDNRAGVHG